MSKLKSSLEPFGKIMDVQLLDEISRKPMAILFDVDNLSSLSKIRELIADQVSEVIPTNEYMFIHHGTLVCKRQEPMLTIEKTTLSSDETHCFVFFHCYSVKRLLSLNQLDATHTIYLERRARFITSR
mgnify:CR=1 FL=1